ncbi:hypothetical protein [Martelella soudanensis]|uniref:hypothetical protein n=1 Tax=unclassified Martelella TaxID=2629616 RepID=UPI0015DEE8B5|nr:MULTISPECIES: hypothetical protein [unclassified Martelella]
MQSIHFFKAGKHLSRSGHSVEFTERDLSEIAQAYDAKLHEAPIVVGHPKTNAPAFGWVDKVVAKPDGLHAVPRQVNAEFEEMVKQGAYKKVSAAFYPKHAQNNPTPGLPYLRHIGFLGAQPPAVKGLSPIEFSEDDDLFFAEESLMALREHSLMARERALRRAEVERTIRNVLQEGRLPIGLLEGTLAFAESLDEQAEFEFSDGDEVSKETQVKWFLEFLEKLPVPLIKGELAVGEIPDDDEFFEAPEGYTVSPYSAELDRLARQHMKHNGGSYADAVRIAEKRYPNPGRGMR